MTLTPDRTPDLAPSLAPDTTFSLADRYQAVGGEVLITGIQVLVRGPLDQLRADRRAYRAALAEAGW